MYDTIVHVLPYTVYIRKVKYGNRFYTFLEPHSYFENLILIQVKTNCKGKIKKKDIVFKGVACKTASWTKLFWNIV